MSPPHQPRPIWSRLRRPQYTLNGGAWTGYSGPLTLGNGVHSVQLRAMDAAGHIATAGETARMDTLSPALGLTGGGSFCPGCGDSLVVNYSVSDGGSGVAWWQLTSGGVTLASGSGPASASLGWDGGPSTGSGLAGGGSLSLEGRDLAGNTETTILNVILLQPTTVPTAMPIPGHPGNLSPGISIASTTAIPTLTHFGVSAQGPLTNMQVIAAIPSTTQMPPPTVTNPNYDLLTVGVVAVGVAEPSPVGEIILVTVLILLAIYYTVKLVLELAGKNSPGYGNPSRRVPLPQRVLPQMTGPPPRPPNDKPPKYTTSDAIKALMNATVKPVVSRIVAVISAIAYTVTKLFQANPSSGSPTPTRPPTPTTPPSPPGTPTATTPPVPTRTPTPTLTPTSTSTPTPSQTPSPATTPTSTKAPTRPNPKPTHIPK
ncbi:MAG: hypothetical protein ABIJ39_05230 [Chloroflexota bacterium]